MIKPTTEEIRNVRRWECEIEGHRFDISLTFMSQTPKRLICTRCGESWSVNTDPDEMVHLPTLLRDNLQISSSEGRRLIQQGGVKIDGTVTDELDVPMATIKDAGIQVGKRRSFRVGGFSLFVLVLSHEHQVHEWCMTHLPLMALPLEERHDLRLDLADGKVLLKYRLSDDLSESVRLSLEGMDSVGGIELQAGDVAMNLVNLGDPT